jgi:hypothetical protein
MRFERVFSVLDAFPSWARAFSAGSSGHVTNGRLLKDLAHAVREVAEGQVARTRESAFPHLDVNRTSMDAHAQPSRIPANSHQLNGGDGR